MKTQHIPVKDIIVIPSITQLHYNVIWYDVYILGENGKTYFFEHCYIGTDSLAIYKMYEKNHEIRIWKSKKAFQGSYIVMEYVNNPHFQKETGKGAWKRPLNEVEINKEELFERLI